MEGSDYSFSPSPHEVETQASDNKKNITLL